MMEVPLPKGHEGREIPLDIEITTVRTYRTKRRIEDMPDGWNGGEL